MTLVLIGKGLVFGGLTFKNRGHWGSRLLEDGKKKVFLSIGLLVAFASFVFLRSLFTDFWRFPKLIFFKKKIQWAIFTKKSSPQADFGHLFDVCPI